MYEQTRTDEGNVHIWPGARTWLSPQPRGDGCGALQARTHTHRHTIVKQKIKYRYVYTRRLESSWPRSQLNLHMAAICITLYGGQSACFALLSIFSSFGCFHILFYPVRPPYREPERVERTVDCNKSNIGAGRKHLHTWISASQPIGGDIISA